MHLNIEIEGLDEVLEKLGAYGARANAALGAAMAEATQFVVDEAKRNAPVDTGDLRASIQGQSSGGGGRYVGEITAGVDYAAYVEFGTGPRGEANHAGTAGGATYTARKWRWKRPDGSIVTVSGMAARPYLYPAVVAARPRLIAAIQKALR